MITKDNIKKIAEMFEYLNDDTDLGCTEFIYSSLKGGSVIVSTTEGDSICIKGSS